MATIGLPVSLTSKIAKRAAQYAREYAIAKGWKSAQGLKPYFAEGEAGITAEAAYLHYVDKGTKPRLMKELEGKTIPMPDGQGGIHFVKVKGVGQPGYVTLPGGVKVWRNQKWLNPGIKAQHFMDDSLQKAIDENQQQIQKVVTSIVNGTYRG